MARLTIIGAGIAGLVSAALAQARGFAVTVVEAGPAVGGIWKSTQVVLGDHRLFLDAGLRLPVATGTPELDDIIFHRPDFRFDWTHFDDWPRESAITANIFNPESSCLDATVLGGTLGTAVADMRSSDATGNAATAWEHGVDWYGPTLGGGLVRDAVMGLFETDLSELAPDAVKLFVPRRVVLGDHQETTRLQADPALSGRVAHARHIDLPEGGHRPFLRPREGGISTWINAFKASLEQAGVHFILNDGVRAVEFASHGRRIERLTLKSGEVLDSDEVICTIAPALLAHAAGVHSGPPPQFRHLRISHLLLDRAPAHRASYSLNFNRHPKFLRAIFHDNLQELPSGIHVLSFEHLVGDDETRDLAAEALEECRQSGAVPAGTQMLAVSSDQYRNTIPVPTLLQRKAAAELQRTLFAAVKNLRFVGRSAGGAPFLDQIILEAETAITAITGSHSHA